MHIDNFIIMILTVILIQVLLFLILENFIYYILNLLIIFIEIGILLIILDNEFLAFLFLIIYAGAIIILFIFVLMLIDLKGVNFNYNLSILKYLILFIIPVFILFYYLISLNLYSYVFFFNDDDIFWYYIQTNTIMFRTITYFFKFIIMDYLNDLVVFNDLTFIAYSLYHDFFIETCILGYFILYCLIFITLLLIEKKKMIFINKKNLTVPPINLKVLLKNLKVLLKNLKVLLKNLKVLLKNLIVPQKNLTLPQKNILYIINILKKENNNIAYMIKKFHIMNLQIIITLNTNEKIAYKQLIDNQFMNYLLVINTLLSQKELDILFISLNNLTDYDNLIKNDICDEEIVKYFNEIQIDFNEIQIDFNKNKEVLILFLEDTNNYFIQSNSILNSNNLKLNRCYIEFGLESKS